MHYNQHRYYDPQQGRYITQDPIGLRGGWNLYGYALNPQQFVDPLGLCVEDLCIIEGGIFLSFLLSAGSTVQTQKAQQVNTDQYGRKVSPEADKLTSEHKSGLNSGGNCTPQDLNDLQSEKNRLCNQSRACSPQMPKNELLRRYEVNLACASVRKQINNQCFGGGDKSHMEEENKAYKTASDCSGLIK